MILKINGQIVNPYPPVSLEFVEIKPLIPKSRKEARKMKKLATTLWGISGSILINSPTFAAENSASIWNQFQPLWSVFQEMSMIIGGIAIFVGLLVFLFKRNVGKNVITTAVIVVAGCYLVPSAIMLVAIIGSMMNDVLSGVFNNLHLENSVKVGGQ